jgi:hypothetical protein
MKGRRKRKVQLLRQRKKQRQKWLWFLVLWWTKMSLFAS